MCPIQGSMNGNYHQKKDGSAINCVSQSRRNSRALRIDGSELIRVIPLSEECKALSEKCVYPLCYMGNNILCSNWDTENLSRIDYNAAYEYFYNMKYGERFDPDKYTKGIPAAEFEDVIMKYLPVTAEEIREWAVYDEATKTYVWENLGCGNYTLSYLGTALPEVVDVWENEDGTYNIDCRCCMRNVYCRRCNAHP